MLQIEILNPDGNVQHLQVPDECVIGKGGQNEVRLDSWRVSKEHARLFSTPSGVLVEDMGAFTGITVNMTAYFDWLRKNGYELGNLKVQ